ncbi:MAG: tyrosine-type recombinase/integrase [Planctomycetes bacterium]|nr:tyrosine-type recombinase/integrase [Planctomycetota bacterium]
MSRYTKTKYRSVYRLPTGKYCYRFLDERGRTRERVGTTNIETTEKLRRQAEDRATAIREGLVDVKREQEQARAKEQVGRVIDEYEQYLLVSKGNSRTHVKSTTAAIVAVVKAAGIECVADFDTSEAIRTISHFLDDLVRRGRSYRTRNHYLISIKGLLNWVCRNRRGLTSNPLGVLDRLDEDLDRRRVSRALTGEEFRKLLAAMPNTSAGRRRRAFYIVCAHTGIRWREVRRLRWLDVDFENRQISLPIRATKNKKAAVLPMNGLVLEALQGVRPDDIKITCPIFDREPRLRTWKDDLARAGIVYVDGSGRLADRKCLRKTFGTWLKDAGVDLRDAQRLMRHQDPKLTAMIYTDPRMPVLQDAVDRLAGEQHPNTCPRISHGDTGQRATSCNNVQQGRIA